MDTVPRMIDRKNATMPVVNAAAFIVQQTA
jgi:hypothetical protein